MVGEKGWKTYLSDLMLEEVWRCQWVDASYYEL